MDDESSLSVRIKVDSVCDEFESEWKSGCRPDIADYLSKATELPSDTLLVELIQIDLHYRRLRGETPDARDYLPQFPHFSEVIERLSAVGQITAEIDRTGSGAFRGPSRSGRFGRYELQDVLGQGGFGVVWRAQDIELDRRVAIKIARVSESPEIHRLFQKEARAMASLNHRHVVRVIDFGIESNLAYIVSELIEGQSLAAAAGEDELDLTVSLEVVTQVAAGLEHVHEQGIIHRDLKPANILLNQDGVAVIADFGLARHVAAESTIASPGQVFGTVPYMSPEQVRGWPVDQRTDVYSLGVVLYRLITGECPFEGSPQEIQHKILHADVSDPRHLNGAVSSSLASVCLRAMARDADTRYATAREFQHRPQAASGGRDRRTAAVSRFGR